MSNFLHQATLTLKIVLSHLSSFTDPANELLGLNRTIVPFIACGDLRYLSEP